MIKTCIIKHKARNGKTSNHMLFKQESPESLVVIFPGGNNSCDRPILHFTRKSALLRGCDVLCISYTDLYEGKLVSEESIHNLVYEVGSSIKGIENDNYGRMIFVSRSFGNTIACKIRSDIEIKVDRHVFLSPVKESFNDISLVEGLVITGTNDKYFTNEDRIKLASILNGELIEIDGAGHSLETNGSIDDNLKIVSDVVNAIDRFVG